MQAQYQTYDSYKDSGVPWLGEIPEEWELLRNKALFYEQKDTVGRKSANYKLLSLTLKGVIPRDMENPQGKFPAEFNTYKKVAADDLIFCLFDVEETPRAVGHACEDGMITGAYTVVKVNSEHNSRFIHYYYLSLDFDKRLNSLYTGLRNVIKSDTFFGIKTPMPDRDVQNRIVTFLDQKTAEIDSAIEKKQRLIDLLKEQKSILINQAVTKGLNPSAPMKDSGIEWIGDIPAHWEVKKLFGLCRFVRGNSAFAKDELLGNGKYVALQYGKTYKVDEIDNSYKFYVNEEFYKESQVVNLGDTVFISTSETIEDLGHSAIYNRDDIGLLGGEQLLIKPNNDLLDHYYIYYSTKVFSKTLRKYATGIKVFRFNINDLKTVYTAVPPKKEQVKIASYITDSLGQVDKAIDLQQAQIEKLKEFKQTLIAHAVTGKIKV